MEFKLKYAFLCVLSTYLFVFVVIKIITKMLTAAYSWHVHLLYLFYSRITVNLIEFDATFRQVRGLASY